MLREAACLQLAERLFQSFAPLNEKDFLPFSVPIFGNLRSVDVLRSLYEVLCEFFLNKLCKWLFLKDTSLFLNTEGASLD